MNSSTSPANESTPVRFCPVCGERTAVILQTDYRRGATGPLVMSTCVEPSCDLHLHTLSDNANLALYGVTAQYDALTGALLPKWMRCSNVGQYIDTAVSREERIDTLMRTGGK